MIATRCKVQGLSMIIRCITTRNSQTSAADKALTSACRHRQLMPALYQIHLKDVQCTTAGLTWSLCTVSMLCAYTSKPDLARCLTAARSPRKSGVRHSTRMSGRSPFSVLTVRAKCSAPPSGMSSLSTDVSTM